MILWIGVACVGFGLAACTQPLEAQLPQAIIALAPSAASNKRSLADLPAIQQ